MVVLGAVVREEARVVPEEARVVPEEGQVALGEAWVVPVPVCTGRPVPRVPSPGRSPAPVMSPIPGGAGVSAVMAAAVWAV